MPDFKSYCFQLTSYLVIPKTQHFDALFREKLIPLFIMLTLVGETMSASVQLNRKFGYHAIEIQKVDTTSILVAELELAETTVAQQTPEPLFCISRLIA